MIPSCKVGLAGVGGIFVVGVSPCWSSGDNALQRHGRNMVRWRDHDNVQRHGGAAAVSGAI